MGDVSRFAMKTKSRTTLARMWIIVLVYVSDQALKLQIAKNVNLTVFSEMLSHFLQSVFVLAVLQPRIICLHYKDDCMSIFGEMWSFSSCLRITNFTLVFTSVIASFDLFTWTNSKIEKYAKIYLW